MAVKLLAYVNDIIEFSSPTQCRVRCHVRWVPGTMSPGTDPEAFVDVGPVDPSGLVATVNQQIRDQLKAFAIANFGANFNGTDTVKLVGSF